MQIINAKNSNVTDSNNINLINCNVTLNVDQCKHDEITGTLNELLERIEKLESELIECKKLIEKARGSPPICY
jgi:hypothetical protein